MWYLNVKHRLNIYRRSFHWKKEGCIFVHVPKAAGTSINKALYGRTLGHYTAQEIKATFPTLFEKSFTFSVVRNPWDRVLSAYHFAKQGRTESMGIYKPERYKIPEFQSFERFVNEWLPKQQLAKVDFVFKPQYQFVCDSDGLVIVDFIGKLENIELDINVVSKKVGKDIELGRDNSTKVRRQGDYRSAYSNKMVDLVQSIYSEDVDRFKYQFE